jgi:hypothetical protein
MKHTFEQFLLTLHPRALSRRKKSTESFFTRCLGVAVAHASIGGGLPLHSLTAHVVLRDKSNQ